jgi:NAD(P)-dependent dehydrogenase (short-subunit alcohol dehydrogenase family)
MEANLGCVLVTGASRRIGAKIAVGLARAGWNVALHYHHSAGEAAAVQADIEALGRRAISLQADLSSEAETARMFAEAAAFQPVTALVNNASLFEFDDFASFSRASWERHAAVNVVAPLQLVQLFQAALPAGAAGSVVNLVDQRVANPAPGFVSYAATRSALWALTQMMAQSLGPQIRANAVGPGPTLASVRQSAGDFARQAANTPLGQPVDPDEIAAAVCYLLASRSVTGQLLLVDAGQHLGWCFSAERDVE